MHLLNTFLIFSGTILPEDCEWSSWGPFSQCSVSCSRSPKSLSSDSFSTDGLLQDVGTQQRIRTIRKQAKNGGTPCDELRDGVQLIRCRAETPCATRNKPFVSDEATLEKEGRLKIYLRIRTAI